MIEPSTRLGFSRGDKTFLAVTCTVVGVGLGFAVPYLAGWAADLPWIPFRGPLELLGSFDSPIATWIRPVVGLLLGLAFTAYLVHQSPVLQVSPEQIEVTSRGATRRIARSEVAGIYREGSKIVVETRAGRRLFHGEIEGSKDAVRDAFVHHGYPWETTE